MIEASTLPWRHLAWGLGILIAVMILYYLVAGLAFFYIYHAAAARRTGLARLVRALFRRSAAEVDDHRSKLDPGILARSDARIVEHTKIYVKKALGCSVWILLLALTIFLVKNL